MEVTTSAQSRLLAHFQLPPAPPPPPQAFLSPKYTTLALTLALPDRIGGPGPQGHQRWLIALPKDHLAHLYPFLSYSVCQWWLRPSGLLHLVAWLSQVQVCNLA